MIETVLLTPPAWTGPLGPVRLPLAVDAGAIAEEVFPLLAVAESWRPLTFYGRPWRVEWAAHSLYGYGPEPTDVLSPIQRLFATPPAERPVGPALTPAGLEQRLRAQLVATPSAAQCPTAMAVAAAIPGATERVRFNVLGPGGIIPKHRDPLHAPTWEGRVLMRVHIPIILPEGCCFFAWDRLGQCHAICEQPGAAWFVDTDCPHLVANGTGDFRFHLVIDKFLDAALRTLLAAPRSGPGAGAVEPDRDVPARATTAWAAARGRD